MKLSFLNICNGAHGIIACGPFSSDRGTLRNAVVLRALTAGMSPAADPTAPDKYVVHNLVIQEDGTVSFDHGNYFHCGDDPQEALGDALCRFNYRVIRKMDVCDPLHAAIEHLLRSAAPDDRSVGPGVTIGGNRYTELQNQFARLTGVSVGIELEDTDQG